MVDFVPAPEAGEGVVKCVNPVLGIVLYVPSLPSRLDGYGCRWDYIDDTQKRVVFPHLSMKVGDGVVTHCCERLTFENVSFSTTGDASCVGEAVTSCVIAATKAVKDFVWAKEAQDWLNQALESVVEPVKK